MKAELTRTFRFEAAHRLTRLPPGHKCGRLHGHSFVVDVTVAGPVDPETGFLMDYAEIKAAVSPIIDALDHQFLNDLEGLENPTSEILAGWIWQRVQPNLPQLAAVTVRETCNVSCTYRGE